MRFKPGFRMTQPIENHLLPFLAFGPRIIAFSNFPSTFKYYRLIGEVETVFLTFTLSRHATFSFYLFVARVDFVDRLSVADVGVTSPFRPVFVARSVLARRSVREDTGLRKRTRLATLARPRSIDGSILRLDANWRRVLSIIQMWLMISCRLDRGLMSRNR